LVLKYAMAETDGDKLRCTLATACSGLLRLLLLQNVGEKLVYELVG